jgi:hypothetical protein
MYVCNIYYEMMISHFWMFVNFIHTRFQKLSEITNEIRDNLLVFLIQNGFATCLFTILKNAVVKAFTVLPNLSLSNTDINTHLFLCSVYTQTL